MPTGMSILTRSDAQIVAVSVLIDAVVSGCFSDEIDDMTAEEEIEWAKEKIGKYLFFDDLSAVSYVAIGKVYIV